MAKKSKKEKIDPKQQSGQVIDLEKQKEGKKKKRGLKLKIFMWLFVILLVAGFVAAYLFNWFSLRQRILNVLIVGDEQYTVKMIEVANEKEKAQGEQALAQDAKAAYEKQLQSLESREKEIAAKEQQIQSRLAAVITNTENNGDTQKSVISMFESMDAENAAKTLQSMNDVDTVASILSSMKKKSSAAIMEAFDTEFAAIVAARMLV